MATANRQLTDYELLLLAPKREHVCVSENIIFCGKCKVGNRIVEGQPCGVCEKLKEKK